VEYRYESKWCGGSVMVGYSEARERVGEFTSFFVSAYVVDGVVSIRIVSEDVVEATNFSVDEFGRPVGYWDGCIHLFYLEKGRFSLSVFYFSREVAADVFFIAVD